MAAAANWAFLGRMKGIVLAVAFCALTLGCLAAAAVGAAGSIAGGTISAAGSVTGAAIDAAVPDGDKKDD